MEPIKLHIVTITHEESDTYNEIDKIFLTEYKARKYLENIEIESTESYNYVVKEVE